MLLDYLGVSVSNLRRRKTRSALTVIGIFIGITAVVALISLGHGLQEGFNQQFERAGSNRIIITAGGGNFLGPVGAGFQSAIIDDSDLRVIKQVAGVEAAAPVLGKSTRVNFKDKTIFANAWGTKTDDDSEKYFDKLGFFDMDRGRPLQSGDGKVAVLGYDVASTAFDKPVSVRDKIEIDGEEFRVVGITKDGAVGLGDQLIRIPLDQARDIFEEPDSITIIGVLTAKGYEPGEVKLDIEKALRKHRGVKRGEEDFTAQTLQQVQETFKGILAVLQIILVGITAISLLVGGIGIMNTMYTSVLERRREIGIMKSIGATNSNILFLFLLESGFLGLVGGILGVLLGFAMSKGVELGAGNLGFVSIVIKYDPVLILGALAFSFVVGSTSGLLPARQAAGLQPVEALKKQ